MKSVSLRVIHFHKFSFWYIFCCVFFLAFYCSTAWIFNLSFHVKINYKQLLIDFSFSDFSKGVVVVIVVFFLSKRKHHFVISFANAFASWLCFYLIFGLGNLPLNTKSNRLIIFSNLFLFQSFFFLRLFHSNKLQS